MIRVHSLRRNGTAETGKVQELSRKLFGGRIYGQLLSSVKSHARAVFQSRITVSEEIFTTSAVSLTLSPPKKRSSTIRDLRGSTSARALSASSRATNSRAFACATSK